MRLFTMLSLTFLFTGCQRADNKTDGEAPSPARPEKVLPAPVRSPSDEKPSSAREDNTPVAAIPEVKLTPEEQADLKELVRGNNQFAFDLYAQLRKKEGNLVFSPYSISSALAMTYAGAKGKTSEEMAAALRFHLPDKQLHHAFSALSQQLQKQDKKDSPKLFIANSLWAQQGLAFNGDFLQLTREAYKSAVRPLDFLRDPEAARNTINRGIAEQTKEMIPELIQRGLINRDTRLVLTNAIYFQADWLAPFKKESTVPMPFHLTATRQIKVPTMTGEPGLWPYLDGQDFQLVELPYRGKELAAVFIVPKKVDGLTTLEETISAESVSEWCSKARPQQRIELVIPKFRLNTDHELKNELTSLGMRSAFTDRSDFSGITNEVQLRIDGVIHKTRFNLDEKGTEAAAATAVVIGELTSLPGEAIRLLVDRPFIFLLRDKRTGSVLFLGRVVDPSRP